MGDAWNDLAGWLRGLIIATLAVIGNQMVSRFRQRPVILRWSARHVHLALSGQHANIGRVQVLYNDRPVQNLFVTTVNVKNESSRDLVDVTLFFSYADGSIIYTSNGVILGSNVAVLFTEGFAQMMERLVALPQEEQVSAPDADYYTTRRDYAVPVLNAGRELQFGFIVSNPTVMTTLLPHINLACEHVGVRLVESGEPIQKIWGIPQKYTMIVGLCAFRSI